jgi:zincin-like metallopeptidase toxin 3 of polymorphic toxin system
MRLSNDTQQTFPKFKHYIQVDFPKLIHVHPIVNALRKYGQMSSAEVHQYLAWGSGPQIIGMKNPSRPNPHFPHALEIEEGYIKVFEADSPTKSPAERQLAVGKNSRGRLVYHAGVTILLSLVRDSARRTLDQDEAQSRANQFGQEVYGGLVQ